MTSADRLLRIGQFARAAGLTAKALRHYDSVGLLNPAVVDSGNGYRRYRVERLAQARLIRKLRALELPVAEVRRLLDRCGEDSEALPVCNRSSGRPVTSAIRSKSLFRCKTVEAGELDGCRDDQVGVWTGRDADRDPPATSEPIRSARPVVTAGAKGDKLVVCGRRTARSGEDREDRNECPTS